MSVPRVNLPVFEGPLDLLLYLIRRDEIDIRDIPISRITEEFLKYVEMIHELNLDAAGDFVVMAATLTTLKSRMLLPPELGAGQEELDDPRLPLVEKLLEYERYKQAAATLVGRELLGRDVFRRGQDLGDDEDAEVALPRVELFDLVEALREVLERARLRGQIHHIDVERFSVVDKIHWLHDTLRSSGTVSFFHLFEGLGSRMEIVLTFLAILEMLKRGILEMPAGEGGDWLIVLRAEEAAAQLPMLGSDALLDVT